MQETGAGYIRVFTFVWGLSVKTSHESKLNLKEEVLDIPVSISFPPECLDHIVHAFFPPRRNRELGMVDNAHEVPFHRIAE